MRRDSERLSGGGFPDVVSALGAEKNPTVRRKHTFHFSLLYFLDQKIITTRPCWGQLGALVELQH